MLVVVILPVVGKMSESAKSAKCQGNLRQLSVSLLAYQQELQQFPKAYDVSTGISWLKALKNAGYLSDSRITYCPTFGPQWENVSGGYAMTSLVLWYPVLQRTDDVPRFFSLGLKRPSAWPLVMDADTIAVYSLNNPQKESAKDSRFTARHNGFANVLMADGHVERVQYGDTRWKQSELNNGTYY